MSGINRRDFVRTASLAAAAASTVGFGKARATGGDASEYMKLGIIVGSENPETSLDRVTKLGFTTCQLGMGRDTSKEMAAQVKAALEAKSISPTALICNGPGKLVWNFYEGPTTIGLVPRTHRAERIARLKVAVDFAVAAGIPLVNSHFGFIPEDPNEELYAEFIVAAREVADYAKVRGMTLCFETGQETPVTLLRAITDIGTGNLGVNYDTANLILYGKANPVDGLDVIGKYVKSMHAKDGMYPTDPRELGEETPIGQGKVDFAGVFHKLKALGYKGHVTIEREIEGPKQTEDILNSKKYLEDLIRTA